MTADDLRLLIGFRLELRSRVRLLARSGVKVSNFKLLLAVYLDLPKCLLMHKAGIPRLTLSCHSHPDMSEP